MNRLFLILLAVTACGDNNATPDAATGDTGTPDAYVPRPRAVAVSGDYMSPGTGLLSRLEVDTLDMRQNVVTGAVQGDPALRYIDGKLYVINRYGSNNITIIDAATLQFEEQISTGEGSNPQDVAVVGNKLYVPALGTAGVVVLTRGSTDIATIDLSSLDTVGTNDGVPECMSAYAVGTKVYVACGVLDNFAGVEPGKVAVIDTATDTMVASATMNYSNPSGFFVRAPDDSTYTGDLLIASLPEFTDYSVGCLERVSTGATPTVGCGLTNEEMGGFAAGLSISHDGSLLWIAVNTYDNNFNQTGKLKGFDLESGSLWTAPVSPEGQLIVGVAACPAGQIVVSDQTLNAGGLRVYNGTTERTTMAHSIGLPPRPNALVCYDP